VINAAVILKGALSLELADGSRRTFGEGEALVEVVNTVHTGQALGDDPV
jgi:quercetin dioxygenase-like cupin family protein